MKHLFFLLLLFTLIGCANTNSENSQNRGFQTPRLSITDDLQSLNLVGKLEVFSIQGEKEILERKFDLTIQQNVDGLQIIPPEGIRVEGLLEGIYIYRISLLHVTNDPNPILLTTIEEKVFMKRGVNTGINFFDSKWRYDFDDDGDGYANVTELMNGHWNNEVWVPDPITDPPKIQLYKDKIVLIPLANDGTATLKGNIHSASSGALITVIHLTADLMTVINRTTEFARLDGSFEISIKNSSVGEKLKVYAVTLPSKSEENLDISTSPYITPKNGEESLIFQIQDRN